MATANPTLEVLFDEWQLNQEQLKVVLAPLSAEQLQLRAAPSVLSVGQLAQHIIAVRVYWFNGFLGEGEGDEAVAEYALWDEPGAPARTAAELLEGLDSSWRLMTEAVSRWTAADLQQTFPHERDGQTLQRSRTWVIWHVLEQNLHHNGELTVTLNMYGLPGLDL
jgi:uncharacterized damage-inducible protein DinB